MKRPNILFLMTDQQAANTLGCYGNDFVNTPSLDGLAAEGIRFDCNVSNCPVCMPARASLLTGRSPEAHGVFRNGFELEEGGLPVFSDLLRQSGYRTVWNGKHHWKNQMDGLPGPGRYFGFDEHHLTDDNQIGPYFDWVCEQGDTSRDRVVGTLFNLPPREHPYWQGRRYISPEDIAAARVRHIEPCMPGEDKSISYWVSPLPDELTQNAWIADRAIESIQKLAGGEEPFFISASFVDPHDPYNPTERFWRELDPRDCPPPRVRAGEHEASPPHYQRYVQGQTGHPWINRVLRQTPEEWRLLRTCYFAKVNAVDYHVGRILKALREAGVDGETAVVFTSDHGDMMGDHGMITKGDFHYDSCIRTPLIIRPPREASVLNNGYVCQTPTSLLDVFPTILDVAGVDKPDTLLLEGRSISPVWTGRGEFDRDFAFAEIYATVDNSHHPSQWARTIRNHKWRYTWFPGGQYGQLFDLEADPDEFDNLWGNPGHAPLQKRLQERLFDMLITRCAPLPASVYPV